MFNFLWKVFFVKGVWDKALSRFKDKDEIPKDSRYAVARFVKLGIIVSNIKILKPDDPNINYYFYMTQLSY